MTTAMRKSEGRGAIEAERFNELLDFYGFLVQANGLIARADDIDRLYLDICRLGVLLDQRLILAWVGMIADDSPEVRVVAHAGPAAGYLEDLKVLTVEADDLGRGPTGRALREGRCIVVNRFLDDSCTRPWQAMARKFGIAAGAAVPLRRREKVCGALMLYAREVDVFDDRIAGELEVLAQTLSYAIDAAADRQLRRQLDEQLLESQLSMRAILDAAQQTILLMTAEGSIQMINRSGAQRLGMSPSEMVGRNLFAILPEDLAKSRRDHIDEALRLGRPVVLEDEREGRSFHTTVYPVMEGAPRVVVYAEDITERVVAERAQRQAEQKFVQVVNLATEGIVALDLQGRITFANPKLHQLLGVEHGALLGLPAVDFIAPDQREDFRARLERVREQGAPGPQQVSFRIVRATGDQFPALVSAAIKQADDAGAVELVAVVTDISELQRAQEELAENQQRLEIALAGAGESIWEWNIESGDAFWSSDFFRQLGYAHTEFPRNAAQWLDYVHPEDGAGFQAEVRRQIASGAELIETTYRIRAKDGQWRWITVRGKVIKFGPDGRPLVLTGTNVDVTVQHLEEERNKRQAQRWLALLRLAQNWAFQGASGERDFFTRALDEAQRLTASRFGFFYLVDDQGMCHLAAKTGATGPEVGAVVALDAAGAWAESFRQRRGVVANESADFRLITVPVLDGPVVRVLAWVGGKDEAYDQDDLEFLQILAADVWRIVRRRRAEAELREALQVVEASPVVCFRWRAEPDWPVDYVSQNVSRWGWDASALVGGAPKFVDLVHPDDLPRVADEVTRFTNTGINEYVQRYRLRRPDGGWFWVEDSTRVIRDANGAALAYEGVVSDIDADVQRERNLAESLETQRALNRKLEAAQNQLLQSEKLASIGQLAAGVAHEINNPIGFVTSNLGTLSSYVGDFLAIIDATRSADEASGHAEGFAGFRAACEQRELDYLRTDVKELLDESRDGLERVRKIVQDLKDFSRVGEAQWQWANLHQGLASTLNIVWNELKYKCEVVKEFGDLPDIYCVPPQLNQVFMNLLVNAAQSIDNQGTITIRTERVGADAVRVSVSDTGRGIPPDMLNRIFEPFFTTKPVGKGTGLGLSLAWSIVERHGGRIEVDSEPGKGSRFTVTLPIRPVVEAPEVK